MEASNKNRNSRLKTREVKVGKINTGGRNPVMIFSVTKTNNSVTLAKQLWARL